MNQVNATTTFVLQPMIDIVKHYLEEQGWKYEDVANDGWLVYGLSFKMEHATYQTTFNVDPVRHYFWVTAYSPILVPKKDRPNVAELITRINYNLPLVKYEMDMSNGEIRVVSSAYVEGSHLSLEMINAMEKTTLAVLDIQFPFFMSVVHGHVTPAQAIELLEADVKNLADQAQDSPATVH